MRTPSRDDGGDDFSVGAVVYEPSEPSVTGVVLDYPATDPDGNVWACHAAVVWNDDEHTMEVLPTRCLRRAEAGPRANRPS